MNKQYQKAWDKHERKIDHEATEAIVAKFAAVKAREMVTEEMLSKFSEEDQASFKADISNVPAKLKKLDDELKELWEDLSEEEQILYGQYRVYGHIVVYKKEK